MVAELNVVSHIFPDTGLCEVEHRRGDAYGSPGGCLVRPSLLQQLLHRYLHPDTLIHLRFFWGKATESVVKCEAWVSDGGVEGLLQTMTPETGFLGSKKAKRMLQDRWEGAPKVSDLRDEEELRRFRPSGNGARGKLRGHPARLGPIPRPMAHRCFCSGMRTAV